MGSTQLGDALVALGVAVALTAQVWSGRVRTSLAGLDATVDALAIRPNRFTKHRTDQRSSRDGHPSPCRTRRPSRAILGRREDIGRGCNFPLD